MADQNLIAERHREAAALIGHAAKALNKAIDAAARVGVITEVETIPMHHVGGEIAPMVVCKCNIPVSAGSQNPYE